MRREYVWLIGVICLVGLLAAGRPQREDAAEDSRVRQAIQSCYQFEDKAMSRLDSEEAMQFHSGHFILIHPNGHTQNFSELKDILSFRLKEAKDVTAATQITSLDYSPQNASAIVTAHKNLQYRASRHARDKLDF